MITYNHDKARQATQFLVDDSYFAGHVRKLRNYVQKPRSLPFKDEAECLNELLVIGRQSLQAMENLISVAEQKRDDRNEYQRKFMAKKRARDNIVIKVQELKLGKKLSLDERKDVLLVQYANWETEKDAELARYPDATWEERNEIKRHFWDQIDTMLPEVLEAAKDQFAPVVRKKKIELVKPVSKNTAVKLAMLKALADAKPRN
jgi:hypothetical protein